MKQRLARWKDTISNALRVFRLTENNRTECPLGLMATKSLVLCYPNQDQPDEPVISITQMNRLDAYLCADCEAPLPSPYDTPCIHCSSTFHLHDTYAMQLAPPQGTSAA